MLESPVAAFDETKKSDFISFEICDRTYVLPMTDVIAVHQVLPTTIFVPGTRDWLSGCFRRGTTLVPLIDLELLFDRERGSRDRADRLTMAISVDTDSHGEIAILVSTIKEFFGTDEIEVVESVEDTGGLNPLVVFSGITRVGAVCVLDIQNALLPELNETMLT